MRGRMRDGRLARLLHRFVPDRNPLRRAVDRLEGAFLGLLMAAFLAGAPLAAVATASWSASASRAIERAQAGWRPVPAVLLQGRPQTAAPMFQAALAARVRARWTAPDGTPRVGRIYVRGRAAAGQVVTIWTSRAGWLVGYPLQHSDLVERAILSALLAVTVVAALLSACWLAVRRVLDRWRLTAWDISWAVTGPQWTRRR